MKPSLLPGADSELLSLVGPRLGGLDIVRVQETLGFLRIDDAAAVTGLVGHAVRSVSEREREGLLEGLVRVLEGVLEAGLMGKGKGKD
jgi:hypothetical protein